MEYIHDCLAEMKAINEEKMAIKIEKKVLKEAVKALGSLIDKKKRLKKERRIKSKLIFKK